MARPGVPGDHSDLLASVLFLGTGALGFWLSRDLAMGELAAMGPGYLPRAMSVVLIALGMLTGAIALRAKKASLAPVRLRIVGAVLMAVTGFAALAPVLGLIIGSLWLVGVSRIAYKGASLRETALLALALTATSVLVFAAGLGVQIKVWPL